MDNNFKNRVKEDDFLEWYFSDDDATEEFGRRMIVSIMVNGSVNISARQLFDECGYIPGHICTTKTDEEYDPSEVVFISDYPNEKIAKGYHSDNS